MRAVVSVASGNFLEMYDFMVFGYYADDIGRTFFPRSDPFASLMLAFMTFGAGFLMRPVGAVLLGGYIDRAGRRRGLLFTLSLMAVGTASIALTPGYASIGLAAPLIVVAGRVLQGLSAGAELGGVSVYLSEISRSNRGFFVSWQSASQQLAVICAALSGVVLTSRLSGGQMQAWGWRVPLLLGCSLAPLIFVLRRTLEETPAFRPSPRRLSASDLPVVGLGVLLVTMTTTSFYLITAYTPTYAGQVLQLGRWDSFRATLAVGLSNFFLLPLMGALSDRVGRRPQLALAAGLCLVTAFPALSWLAAAPSFPRLLAVELWLSFVYAAYNGAMVVHLTEIVPASVRTSTFSLAYSLATALFGGFTPAICHYLINATGDPATPGLWLACAAACGLVATLLAR